MAGSGRSHQFATSKSRHSLLAQSYRNRWQGLNWNWLLVWTVIFTPSAYPDGKTDCFGSRMSYAADHELVELIGFGFGLRLNVSVENGELLYRSNGHFWQCGPLRLNIPDCLLLGKASIRERAVSADEFYLDFSIRHPWWGVSYYYRGNFRYR